MLSRTLLSVATSLYLAIPIGSHATAVPLNHDHSEMGNWHYGLSVDPYTGQLYPYASLHATTNTPTTTAVISLLCSRYHTIVNVYWGQPLSGEHIKVQYTPRLNLNTSDEYWPVSRHSSTLVYPRDGNELFDYLLASPRITLEAFPENSPPLVANFSTYGAATALQELITVCGK